MSINFEDDRMQSIEAANDASTLSEKVMQLKDIEDEIANAEKSIKKLKEQAKIISYIEIPQMMETMHIKKLKLKDGESVEVTKFYSASIAQGRKIHYKKRAAFEWLRKNGRGDIIKNDITVTFGQWRR
jgi:vacuolar-type H+-ATPase subunit D/Vma8